MLLISKHLHVRRCLQRPLPRPHPLPILMSRREHAHGDRDPRRVRDVHHCGVCLHADFKRGVGTGEKGGDFGAPAELLYYFS